MASSKKKLPEINGASLADIAFMMLAFILLVSTMDQDTGLMRRLPPMPPEDQKPSDIQVNQRNLIQVRITRSDALFAAGRPNLDVAQLKDIIVEYITNPANRADLPGKKDKDIPGFGTYPVSEAVISLQNDRETSYEMYIRVQNELLKAVNQVRNDFALAHFAKPLSDLTQEQKDIVSEAVPSPISEAEPKQTTRR
jgi:Biopolymer transport protein ExbD/TolR.